MSAPRVTPAVLDQVSERLTALRLPTLAAELPQRFVAAGQAEVLPLLLDVLALEVDERHRRRVDRLRHASKLPPGKTLATLDERRLPRALVATLRDLATGDFLERAVNVLCFGLPGVGKSHAACALGHELVNAGRSVLFAPAYQLIQELLAAKRDLALPKLLRRLDAFELLILDDIGYVQQSAEETEVLFTLLAERYERRSLLITSNLVFSQWDRIFKSPVTTAAAIDRLVHHATILEFDVASFRTEAAKKRAGRTTEVTTTTPTTTTSTGT